MWSIAIPSYKRHAQLATKTLATLEKYHIPQDKITIFVVSEELELYIKSCPGYAIVVGEKGLVNQRNFIERYYPKNAHILFMDDDISDLYYVPDCKTRGLIPDLNQFISDGFLKMTEVGATLWGIYPVDNCLFAFKSKPETLGLSYIVGAFYGQKNTQDIWLTDDSVEDRERTILRFIRDKKVLRFNHYGMKTKYFAPGGMMNDQRQISHKLGSENLVARYPSLCRIKKRKNGYIDCQIKSITE